MLRLKLEFFEVKNDERGYASKINKQDMLEVVVEDSSHGGRLLEVLERFLRPEVKLITKV